MTEAAPVLNLIGGAALEAELRTRRSPWLYKRVAPSEVAAHEADGWTQTRANKSSVRLQKRKPIDQTLEDDVWSLLARLGFTHLSSGRRFVIPVTKGPGEIASKDRSQGFSIDVAGPYLKMSDGTIYRDRRTAARSLWRELRSNPELAKVIEWLPKRSPDRDRARRGRTAERMLEAVICRSLVGMGISQIRAAAIVIEWCGRPARDPKRLADGNRAIWREAHIPLVAR